MTLCGARCVAGGPVPAQCQARHAPVNVWSACFHRGAFGWRRRHVMALTSSKSHSGYSCFQEQPGGEQGQRQGQRQKSVAILVGWSDCSLPPCHGEAPCEAGCRCRLRCAPRAATSPHLSAVRAHLVSESRPDSHASRARVAAAAVAPASRGGLVQISTRSTPTGRRRYKARRLAVWSSASTRAICGFNRGVFVSWCLHGCDSAMYAISSRPLRLGGFILPRRTPRGSPRPQRLRWSCLRPHRLRAG